MPLCELVAKSIFGLRPPLVHLSVSVPMSCHGCLEIYVLLVCLQAEGGKRAGAVATVVAAVDLARVRLPVHVEGAQADDEEEAVALKAELRQQATAMAAAQQYEAGWTTTRAQAGQMLTTAQEFTPQPSLPLPQVS